MDRNIVRANEEQRARLELRLFQFGESLPSRKPWDDAVTYNDALLEAVELAEERLADRRHQLLARTTP